MPRRPDGAPLAEALRTASAAVDAGRDARRRCRRASDAGTGWGDSLLHGPLTYEPAQMYRRTRAPGARDR